MGLVEPASAIVAFRERAVEREVGMSVEVVAEVEVVVVFLPAVFLLALPRCVVGRAVSGCTLACRARASDLHGVILYGVACGGRVLKVVVAVEVWAVAVVALLLSAEGVDIDVVVRDLFDDLGPRGLDMDINEECGDEEVVEVVGKCCALLAALWL